MRAKKPSASAANVRVERSGNTLSLRLAGRFATETTAPAWRVALRALDEAPVARLAVDASGIDYCDGSGTALLLALEERQRARGAAFELTGLREDFTRLLDLVRPREPAPSAATEPPPGKLRGAVETFGRSGRSAVAGIAELVSYAGEISAAFGWALLHPRRVRWRDALLTARLAGLNALPIILLVGFLMGLILAFQSAVQLKRFAAEIFTADAVGLSLVRELGALMTAVILAGRSGSAFAAELGTMKVNEELDALTTMSLDPVRFLVVTRVIASVAVMPILVLFFNLAGLAGGMVVVVSLGFPPITFVNRVAYAVVLGDLYGGLVKALVFSVLVTAVGCLRGMQTGSGARAVGESATSAVVSGIVLIAVADGILSVVYYVLGI